MTKKQMIGKRRVSSAMGIAVVVVSFLLIFLANLLFSYLSSLGISALATSIGFWLVGGALAAYVFHTFVLMYVYTLDGVKLVVERIFSKKPRFMAQVLLREIVYIAPLAEAKAKYPRAASQRATRKQEPHPEIGVVYKRNGEIRMLILQPDEEFLAALKVKKGHP